MRLIDADALRLMKVEECAGHTIDYAAGWKACIEWIKTLPTIDAVPVVRCKDCRYRKVNEHYGERGYLKIKATCLLDNGDIYALGRDAEDDNWFCADGERREDK